MSTEDQQLLARISQLAGQINRHRSHQSTPQPPPQPAARPQRGGYRHTGSPYRGRGHRYGPPPASRHRTLQLNNTTARTGPDAAADSSDSASTAWVSRTDRHRQLINANVFEKESQNRAKAIEQTRLQKLRGQRRLERARLKEFLRTQHAATSRANAQSTSERNEIEIDGIRFRVMDQGKKLCRVLDNGNPASETPKSATIAGVQFHRTKTGNMVISRIVKDHRRLAAVKKINEACKIFSLTGSCSKGPKCRFLHDPDKVALCKEFLKEGKCVEGDICDLSHDMTPERVPNCLHYAKGQCTKPDCPFTHSKALSSAPVCHAFGRRGYCENGAECTDRHVFECPDFSNTGQCKVRGCKLPHRERASVLRNRTNADEQMEDVSSDDEHLDSDDVDSDEIAEFIDADSDVSDVEDGKDFLAI